MLYSAPCLNLSSNFFRHIVHAFVVMLFSAFWATTAFAVPTSPSIITFSQTKTTHFAQGTDVNFAARAPPMAMPNVEVAGGVTVMQGSAFALHGQEKVAALFGFSDDLVATNKGADVVDVSAGCKGSWCKILNKPEPNTSYKVDSGHTFKTDGQGRTSKVEANLELKVNDRNTYQQCKAGKCGTDGDEGGHLIASIFKGPGEKINLVPMNGNLNKGEWKKLENTWANALKDGKPVKVNIEPNYAGDSVRPDDFKIEYSIGDGRPVILDFKNTPGGN
jgi:hypothetical protein